ncbi:beta-N-acetylhexosaminidase [Teredinibacter sp. KSP-S5-2]|uniref:beta-N-acetylhexosaminidase n=1 Tax=Teredinibacter sp. KSP-S5-2 TaxID=3034506 RepID=UPI0029345C3C|nr:beta-N-acetylhexosaminidase [Teredinibacter sp. KSP-S5-2]WNO07579.1 beta-N-acetylhexosaminidase [Teredinibacter sp. KSP-S5-2]
MSDIQLGPVVTDVSGPYLTSEDRDLLLHPMLGGIILFARNYQSPEQLIELVESIRAINPRIVISVDQEGGRVQRFKEGFTRLPSMQKAVDVFVDDEERLDFLSDLGWLMASEVIAHGVDHSYAPVLDADDCQCKAIGDRSFSKNPEKVTDYATAFIRGMNQAGMSVTGKHFPGHGKVTADSHHELPVDDRSIDQLYRDDLIPFVKLLPQLNAIMPAHILFPQIDPVRPVGFSKKWVTEILKEKMGFKGIVFSDDLTMQGAASVGRYSVRAEMAFEAGCDIAVVCNNPEGGMEVLNAAEKVNLTSKQSLQCMRARQQISVNDLKQTERWLAVQDKLKKYNLTN